MDTKKVTCNMCGKTYISENDVIKQDFFCMEKDWGYFSNKDGQHHSVILCEKCYDQWIKNFAVQPLITDIKEYL